MEEAHTLGHRQVRLLTRKNGSTAVIEQSISPISDRAGTVSGSVVVFRELNPVQPAGADRI